MKYLIIYIDGWCPICKKFRTFVIKSDILNLIEIKDIRKEKDIDEKKLKLMYSKSLNGKSYYGFDSMFEINKRLIVFWILIPIMYVLKISRLGHYLYNELSVKRKIIPLTCNSECSII